MYSAARTRRRKRKMKENSATLPPPPKKTKLVTEKKKRPPVSSRMVRSSRVGGEILFRAAVAHFYYNILDAPEPSTWRGRGGNAGACVKALSVPIGSTGSVLAVFKSAYECLQKGNEYTPYRKKRSENRNRLISRGSVEEQIIADCFESGGSTKEATEKVNEYRSQINATHVGNSTVLTAMHRLKPVIRKIGHKAMGNYSPDSTWAKGRFGWARQLAIQYGVLTWEEPEDPPAFFDIEQIGKIERTQVAWWDETSKACILDGGFSACCKREVRFRRDENGRPDPNGKNLAQPRKITTVKFTQHADLVLGVAMIEKINEEVCGIRLKPVDYTGCWIHTIESMDNLRGQAWVMAKTKGSEREFVTGKRPKKSSDAELFTEDPVSRVMGIGPTKAKALSEKGINTVGDLLASSAVNISAAVRSRILKAMSGAYQDKTVDHRNNPKQPNPFISRWGVDNWKEKCDATAFMKKHVCITTYTTACEKKY